MSSAVLVQQKGLGAALLASMERLTPARQARSGSVLKKPLNLLVHGGRGGVYGDRGAQGRPDARRAAGDQRPGDGHRVGEVVDDDDRHHGDDGQQ